VVTLQKFLNQILIGTEKLNNIKENTNKSSYKQILKSSSIFGGAQLIQILLGIARTKAIAILLGPNGVGISSLFQSTTQLIANFSGLGINVGSVKFIAEAKASSNSKLAQTISIIKKLILVTAIIGALCMLIFRNQISVFTFNNQNYTIEFAFLSLAVFLIVLNQGNLGIIQGLRLIKAYSLFNIYSAILGLIASVLLYYFWGIKGIVPAIILIAAFNFIIIKYLTRSKNLNQQPHVKPTKKEFVKHSNKIISLSFFMFLTILLTFATNYIIRIVLVDFSDTVTVGFYQAAYNITIVYVGMIFSAMSADFYPRLSENSSNNPRINSLVNEQTEIALLLAFPLIIGLISFSDLTITILYSKEFLPSAELLNLLLIGTFFKTIGWPIGFVLLAKGRASIMVFTELIYNSIFFLIFYFTYDSYNIQSIGYGYIIAYSFLLLILYIIVNKLTKFNFSRKSILYILVFAACIAAAYLVSTKLAGLIAIFLKIGIILLTTGFSLYQLNKTINLKSLLNKFLKRQ